MKKFFRNTKKSNFFLFLRGAAHVGLIKALHENGIPVDIVGGTSIGSLISGILATNPNNMENLEEKASKWFLVFFFFN